MTKLIGGTSTFSESRTYPEDLRHVEWADMYGGMLSTQGSTGPLPISPSENVGIDAHSMGFKVLPKGYYDVMNDNSIQLKYAVSKKDGWYIASLFDGKIYTQAKTIEDLNLAIQEIIKELADAGANHRVPEIAGKELLRRIRECDKPSNLVKIDHTHSIFK